MDRRRAPSLALFAALSFALHAASFYALGRAASASAHFDPSTQTVTGDTLDVEQAERAASLDEGEGAETAPGQETAPEAETAPEPATPAAPSTRPRGRAPAASLAPLASAQGTASAARPPPAVFGAVGVRYAADLATTFTRAFPQAASADAVWESAAFGPAGVAEVTLALDDEGRLNGSSIGGAPSAALRRGIERTLALLGSRAFTARGAVTRLRLSARVARDSVHDGLHGDVFALSGGSFSGDTGTAFFALPSPGGGPGRRVDVELRLLP